MALNRPITVYVQYDESDGKALYCPDCGKLLVTAGVLYEHSSYSHNLRDFRFNLMRVANNRGAPNVDDAARINYSMGCFINYSHDEHPDYGLIVEWGVSSGKSLYYIPYYDSDINSGIGAQEDYFLGGYGDKVVIRVGSQAKCFDYIKGTHEWTVDVNDEVGNDGDWTNFSFDDGSVSASNVLYVVGNNRFVAALDMSNGSLIWRYDLEKDDPPPNFSSWGNVGRCIDRDDSGDLRVWRYINDTYDCSSPRTSACTEVARIQGLKTTATGISVVLDLEKTRSWDETNDEWGDWTGDVDIALAPLEYTSIYGYVRKVYRTENFGDTEWLAITDIYNNDLFVMPDSEKYDPEYYKAYLKLIFRHWLVYYIDEVGSSDYTEYGADLTKNAIIGSNSYTASFFGCPLPVDSELTRWGDTYDAPDKPQIEDFVYTSEGYLCVRGTYLNPDTVIGSDLNEYYCIQNHLSDSTNKPITGADWRDYWRATGNTGDTETWTTGTNYSTSNTNLRWWQFFLTDGSGREDMQELTEFLPVEFWESHHTNLNSAASYGTVYAKVRGVNEAGEVSEWSSLVAHRNADPSWVYGTVQEARYG